MLESLPKYFMHILSDSSLSSCLGPNPSFRYIRVKSWYQVPGELAKKWVYLGAGLLSFCLEKKKEKKR
jgi:hypothetical protein